MKVLVTGAGGPAGVSVIRALTSRGLRVVAADADPDAVGLRLSQARWVLPRADDEAFAPSLIEAVEAYGVEVVVPTVAEELVALLDVQQALSSAGATTWLPARDAVESCVDKWLFAEAMEAAGVPAPRTGLQDADGIPGPWIVKPRFGRGSRDVVLADDDADLTWALKRVPEPIVQTRVSGREFTVDALVDRDGTLAAAVPRWRLETKAGISTKGETFSDDRLAHTVGRVLGAVGLTGPANVQGFMTPDGAVKVIEVNPRFSGGLPLSLAAGADLVGQYLRGARGLPLQPERLGHRAGVRMLRHFDEVYEC
jgi:carbamoyl-phosphate synthase large subunit